MNLKKIMFPFVFLVAGRQMPVIIIGVEPKEMNIIAGR